MPAIIRVVEGRPILRVGENTALASWAANASEAAALVATEAAASASEKADVAEYASEQIGMYSAMYPSTVAGLAAVIEGGYFSVPTPDEDFSILYRKTSGVAVEVNRYPSKEAVAAKAAAAAIGVSGTDENMGTFASPLIPNNVSAKDAIEGLAEGLAEPTGSGGIGFDPTATYAQTSAGSAIKLALRPSMFSTFTRRVLHHLPHRFPDYDALIIQEGSDFIYPQSMNIREDTGELYISYIGSGGSTRSWFTVWDWATGAYKYCFSTGTYVDEGFAIYQDGGNTYLYSRQASGSVGRFDITTPPANKSYITPVATINIGIGPQMARDGDSLVIVNTTPAVGELTRRYVMTRLDLLTLSPRETITFDNFDSGNDASVVGAGAAAIISKRQGFASAPGMFVGGFGGVFNTGDPITPYVTQGIKIFNSTGGLVYDGLCDPEKFITRLNEHGLGATRIENEGAFIAADGRIMSLFVTRSATSGGDLYNGGLVIFEEMAQGEGVIDFEDCRVTSARFDRQIFEGGPAIRSASGYSHPITGVRFNSLNDICDFMIETDVRSYTLYSSHTSTPAVTDFNGAALFSRTTIRLTNIGNTRFIMETQRDISPYTYMRYVVDGSPRTQRRVAPLGIDGFANAPDVANDAVFVGDDARFQFVAFTAPRTLALSKSQAVAGDNFEYLVAAGSSAATVLNGASGPTIATLAAGDKAKFVYNGTDWIRWS